MIPVVPHPFRVFPDHLIAIEVHLILRPMPGVASPHEVFVLDQQARFVGDVEPSIGHRTDAKTKTVPVHFMRDLDEQLPYPGFVPRQSAREWIFKETVQSDIGDTKEIKPAVQIGSSGRDREGVVSYTEYQLYCFTCVDCGQN